MTHAAPTKPIRASAAVTPFGDLELRFPYRAELVDDLKTEIPPKHRRWDGDEKRWLVSGRFTGTAIGLLLARFPQADIPPDHARPPRVVTSPPPPASVPLPPPLPFTRKDAPEPAPLVVTIPCPCCGARYEQSIRVVAESSMTVTKREKTAPELIAVCPSCRCLAVVAFYPAVAAAQAAS